MNMSRIKFCETSFADGFASCNRNLMKYSGSLSFMKLLLFFFQILALTMALSACSEPCDELGDKICSCEKTSSLEEACKQKLKNSKSRIKPTDQEQDICGNLIDTCTCEALALEQYDKCGFTSSSL